MRKLLYLLIFLPTFTQAQVAVGVLETPGARLSIPSNGFLFYDYGTQGAGYEVPIGNETYSLYNSSLWIGGLTTDGELKLAGLTYCSEGGNGQGFCDYYPGPLTTDGTAHTTTEDSEAYNQVWVLSRLEIDAHIAYYECMENPDCDIDALFPDGYVVPNAIATWPAHGDVSQDYPEYLAPFIDVSQDGVYDPSSGDYPEFCGDYAAYIITNDADLHFESFAASIGVEIHTMVYGYDTGSELDGSIFVRQKLINRSTVDLHDAYVAVWSDFDIGYFLDDFIGTDVARGMLYAYNGDSEDEVNPGYGEDLPALGCIILDGPLADANGDDDPMPYDGYERYGSMASGWGDGIVDNERIGMSSATGIYESGPLGIQTPSNGVEFYNYMAGLWKDGLPILHGGFGYDADNDDLLATKYMYPGLSDPMFEGTTGVDPEDGWETGWTEGAVNAFPSDRRMLASMGPFTFEAGSEETIEYAYVYARQSQDPETPVLELLADHADQLLTYQCTLQDDVVTNVASLKDEVSFQVYPNPAKGEFSISLKSADLGHYRIYNIVGQEIASGKVGASISKVDIQGAVQGLYFVKVEIGNASTTQKIVIED